MKVPIATLFFFTILASAVSCLADGGPSCPQMKTCAEAIEASENANLDSCLAGKPHEIGISLRASIDTIKKAISGDLKANYDAAVRASSQLNDDLQLKENAEIRSCLEGFRSIINRCMQKAADQCLAESNYPPGIDLLFRMTFQERSLDVFDGDRLAISYLEPEHYQNPAEHDLNRQGWYADRVDMRADGRFNAVITRVVKNGFDPRRMDHLIETPICLRWSPNPPPPHTVGAAFYDCNEASPNGSCGADAMDVGWLERCPEKKAAFHWPSFGLVTTAHADTGDAPSWVVPSLATLNRWRENSLVGFTEFDIATTAPVGIDADRAGLRVHVNGAELLIDGIRAEYQAKPSVPGAPLRFAFGVQTLNLDGRFGGCNRISLDVLYFNGSKEVARHSVARNFAAMRQIPRIEKIVEGTALSWTGIYLRPRQQPEHMVFVTSVSADSFDNPEQLAKARTMIETAKARFDAAQLQIDGKQLVGVIRPPLTNPAYGLGVAMVEPSGQLQFVFSKEDAIAIKTRLETLIHARTDLALIIDKGIFAYPESKDTIRDSVCPTV
jgi:hypothetical protein